MASHISSCCPFCDASVREFNAATSKTFYRCGTTVDAKGAKKQGERCANNQTKQMVAELLQLDEGLQDWEIRFLDDMDKKSAYTHPMRMKVQEIYRERM